MTELGIEVPIESIAKELKALWAGNSSRTNACMMNLAVFTENPEHLEDNSQVISELTKDHSCRALSVALDRHSSESDTTLWLTAHCNMSNGKKTVCCEQLSFLLKGYKPGRMRNTVFANLNSDLPLVFWWQGELTEVFEPQLYTLIDRFIFDSSTWSEPKKGYEKIMEAAAEVQKRFTIQDIAWKRSYNARMAFAALFDEPIHRKELVNISSASVKVGKGLETTGLLILAWMATQSEWEFHSKNSKNAYSFKNTVGNLIHTALDVGGSVCIAEIGMKSDSASFSVECRADERHVFHQKIKTQTCIRNSTSPALDLDTNELVAMQLSRGGKNALLSKVIPILMKLMA